MRVCLIVKVWVEVCVVRGEELPSSLGAAVARRGRQKRSGGRDDRKRILSRAERGGSFCDERVEVRSGERGWWKGWCPTRFALLANSLNRR